MVFVEEVEQALKQHPEVYDAVVVGTPDERFGQCVTAIVQLRPAARTGEDELSAAARCSTSAVVARTGTGGSIR